MSLKSGFALASLGVALLGLASPAHADLETFDITYSGASFGNSAVGTGFITLDLSVLKDPGFNNSVMGAFVTDLGLTISGASSGNGTYSLADYNSGGSFLLDTNGGTLDLNTELVGQSTNGNPFGSTGGGDFNLFPNSTSRTAPQASGPFKLTTNAGIGDPIRLTSFAPAATPEPGSLAMFAGMALMGTGAAFRRRRKAANTA